MEIPIGRVKRKRKRTELHNINDRPNYAKADFQSMCKLVSEKYWGELYEMKNPNEAADYFQNFMDGIVRETVPTMPNRHSKYESYPPWFTKEISLMLKAKERARRKYKKNPSPINEESYKSLRRAFKSKIKQNQEKYEISLEQELVENPMKFWRYINTKKTGTSDTSSKIYQGQEVCSAQEIVNAFARHFSSVYTTETSEVPTDDLKEEDYGISQSVKIDEIQQCDVSWAIRKMKAKKSLGPDGIPSYIYIRDYGNTSPLPLLSSLICVEWQKFIPTDEI